MSHFSVLVITDSRPSEEELAAVLQPWHEFECTDIGDQYVVGVDRTEEALAEFAKATVVRIKGPDGTLHDRFDEDGNWKPEFSRPEPQRPGGIHRVEFIPAGFERVELPASDVESAADWISGYYGWPICGRDPGEEFKYGRIEVDADGNVVKCIDRTNPNKKWDWWQLGGRWSGHLRVKEGALAFHGHPGLAGARSSDHRLAADQALVRDVDFDTPRAEARSKAYALWDKVHAVVSRHPPFEDWDTVRARYPGALDDARDFYWAQPAIAALKEAFKDSWGLDQELEAARADREAYAQRCADSALNTFAAVKDGQWYERGGMGWWGMVFDEKDKDAWTREFAALLDGLPGDACLSVVDCHI